MMRIKGLAGVAMGIAVAVSISVPVEAAKPRTKAGSVAKRAAAKQAAAAAAAARREAEDKAAAEAAERARVRAQWGLLADIGDSDFENRDVPVTLRRVDGGNAVEMTSWSNIGRAVVRFSRDPASGRLSYGYVGRAPEPLTLVALPDGTIEATDAKGVRWPFLKRLVSGELQMMARPGAVGTVRPMVQSGKAAARLVKLVSAGKVWAVGNGVLTRGAGAPAMASSENSATIVPPATQKKLSWEERATLLVPGQTIARETNADDRKTAFIWREPCFRLKTVPGRTYMVQGEFGGEINYVFIKRGCGDTSPIAALSDEKGNRADRTSVFPGEGGPLYADIPMRGTGRKFKISLVEISPAQLAAYKQRRRQAEAAAQEAKSQSGGNNGFLGGLIMGGVAAAAGGDAGMIMGAAMKGVEMTTDNQMSRNVLAGEGDAMIQSSIELKNQKAELERLRVAAAEETRQQQEREASSANRAASVAPTSTVTPAAGAASVSRLPQQASASSAARTVYMHCNQWIEASTGKRTSYVSQVGALSSSGEWRAMEADANQRWLSYLATLGVSGGLSGCRLDIDQNYNADIRNSFIGFSKTEGDLHEVSWKP